MGANHAKFAPQYSKIASLIPEQLRPVGPMPLNGREGPLKGGGGLYVSEFSGTSIFGYKANNKKNGPPTCSVGPVSAPNGIAVDGKGNLIDPDGGTRSIIIFGGPAMCGAAAATITDSVGQPADASSADAMTKTIAVGNIFNNSGLPGSISVCTVKKGCTSDLTNSGMNEVAGVAMDNKGNCWADAENSSGLATLTYFAKCKGAGVAAKGFTGPTSFGGLDIDNKGNLVVIDAFANGTGQLFVFKGCNPTCTLVNGPMALHGEAVFGHLNKKSTAFATGDFINGQVDVYKYNSATSTITYSYSFNNGLSASLDVEGAAFNPRSVQ